MQRNRYYLITTDILAYFAAFASGGYVFWGIRQPESLFPSLFSWMAIYLAVIPIGITWFYLKGHYTRRWPFWDELRGVVQILVSLAIIESAFVFLTKSSFSRIWLASTFTSLFILLPLTRYGTKHFLFWIGEWRLPTVIVGTGSNASDVLGALSSEHMMGFDIKFFLSLEKTSQKVVCGLPVQSCDADYEKTLADEGIGCVVVALDQDLRNGNAALLERLQRYTQDLYLVPALRGVPLFGMEIHHFFRHEVIMLRVRNNLLRPVVRLLKRCFDLSVAAVLLFFLSPIFVLLGVLVKIDGGPMFYCHRRVGLNGGSFRCLKFRSMVCNADELLESLLENDTEAQVEWEKGFKLKQDPRITRIGTFLRNSSLDELPQLWNVLKGDMSLVGPRPLLEDELKRYGDQVGYYLQVRPGMTGLWQVSGRNDVDYNHRVYLDVWYVKNWSLWYDFAILFKTIRVVLGKQGAY